MTKLSEVIIEPVLVREVAELYLAVMEANFKSKEGDREQQLAKLKSQLGGHEANLLKFDQQRFVIGELEADPITVLSVILRTRLRS